MLSAALLSTVHLLALAIGLPSVFLRARALAKVSTDASALPQVFAADNVWGLAALLWLATGLTRLFGPFEKGSQWYLHSNAFWLKMALFGAVFALELWPMVTLIGWRRKKAKGAAIDFAVAGKLSTVSHVETALTLAIPFVASMMARGIWH